MIFLSLFLLYFVIFIFISYYVKTAYTGSTLPLFAFEVHLLVDSPQAACCSHMSIGYSNTTEVTLSQSPYQHPFQTYPF